MGLFDNAQRLVRSGRFVELASKLPSREDFAALAPEQRLVFARAFVHTAQFERALDIVRAVYTSDASSLARATSELLLGWIARSTAQLTSGREHYALAWQMAREGKHDAVAALAGIQLLRLLSEVQPSGGHPPLLADVRRQVFKAGDPQLSAYMHNTVAMLEASNGRLSEARRHLDICEALLADEPNAWLEQLNCLSLFFVYYHECNYSAAIQALQKARSLLATTGDLQKSVINGNYGHALAVLGQFELAIETLESLSRTTRGLSRLGALDGLAATYLSMGRLQDCEAALNRLDEASAADAMVASAYTRRWMASTRIKLLLEQGRYEEALEHSELFHKQDGIANDPILSAQIRCLGAEAAALAGAIGDAARTLFQCAISDQNVTPDQYPVYYRAASRVLSASDDTLSQPIAERALSVWSEYKHVSAKVQFESFGLHKRGTALHNRDLTADVLTSVAAALRFAGNANLFSRELLRILEATGCAATAKLIQSHGSAEAIPSGSYRLGRFGNRTLSLKCDVPKAPRDAILLADVLRIGRAAVELERYRQDERNRAALWPADPIETEAGALFLAEEMQSLLTTARRIATSNIPVLITGETGTGKEVLARLIHAYSTRAKAPFLPFNCSATPKEMLDAQLFGHRRGAFTGATDNFPGVIRAAAGGTLLLDEIGETTLDVQPKLLRFLESGEVHPIGEAQPLKVDVRIIAATNADLDTLVSEGRFRDDLFYRLNIVRLHLPPLRERRVEIPALADHYLRKYAKENGKGDLRLAEETMEYLVLYRWPGNVRQLANEMRRMAALAESGAVLMPEHLSADIFSSRKTIPASERTLEPTELVVRVDQPMAAAVQHVERAMIIYAMKKCGGGMEETAALLGLSRKGLYLKRQRYAIESPGEGAAAVA